VGLIGNRYKNGHPDGPWEGYAPDAEVLVANGVHTSTNPFDYQKAYEWARSKGANVVTMSWHYLSEETDGDLHARDVYFDYWAVRDPFPSIFIAAGKRAGVYAAGKGYHLFGVADMRNDGDGNRANDTIASTSPWRNPTSGREVPLIAAPGSHHEVLGTIHNGTSAATPAAASVAAVLMSGRPQLKVWPEGVRAILLATANYQGGDGADWSPLSDGKDGTGLINAQYAYLTAKRREKGTHPQYRAHDYGAITAAQFQNGFFNKCWKVQHDIAGSRMRIAFTWNKGETCSSGEDLDSDLDLVIFDPDMNEVASSMSAVNNYEFVEFTPQKVGTYTIKIRGALVPDKFKSYFGVAWTAHSNIDP
jgi:serine protease AprX